MTEEQPYRPVKLNLKGALRRQIIEGLSRPIQDDVCRVIENAEIEVRIPCLVSGGNGHNNAEKNKQQLSIHADTRAVVSRWGIVIASRDIASRRKSPALAAGHDLFSWDHAQITVVVGTAQELPHNPP